MISTQGVSSRLSLCLYHVALTIVSSETQLRSRLKKWRVTKPSRQVRKKPQGSSPSGEDADSEDVKGSSSSSPRNHKPSKETSGSRPEWSNVPLFAPSDGRSHAVDRKWNAPLVQQLTPSPSREHLLVSDRSHPVHSFEAHSTTTSFEQPSQTSPVSETLMLNTTSAVTPTYTGYPLSPESCLPSPGSATAPAMAPWPPRSVSVDLNFNNPIMAPGSWCPVPLEPITPASGVPHSGPGYRHQMHMVHSNSVIYPHDFDHYGEASGLQGYDAKQWKRAMSLQEDFAGYHRRPGQVHGKPPPSHGQPPPGMVPLPSTQPTGPHAVMCAPIVPYMGQDPMAEKPPGVGY